MSSIPTPMGDPKRDAIESLSGYIYQIHQSALAWLDLAPENFLFLEVAEDYVIAASDALNAVQVKETHHKVTINSEDIVASINSFVKLKLQHPDLLIQLRHLTTSHIGKEKSKADRVGDTPTLELWRQLARTGGDISPLRDILQSSKISDEAKGYIDSLNDSDLKNNFLRLIHFDCGAHSWPYLPRLLRSKLRKLILKRGGTESQISNCLNEVLCELIKKAALTKDRDQRFVDSNDLEKIIDTHTQLSINKAAFEKQNRLVIEALSASLSSQSNMISSQEQMPRLLDDVPLPRYLAARTEKINRILSVLKSFGVCWIFGTAGVGKTLSAQITAKELGGCWGRINLRGLSSHQVNTILNALLDSSSHCKYDGFLIDDLECSQDSSTLESLLPLFFSQVRKDKLLILTSPHPPNSDFIFEANLSLNIGQKIEDFTEEDIKQILNYMGVDSQLWTRYISLISGGGHPQLVSAAIQSMQQNDWDISELKTLDSLLTGNSVIEQVRLRTRSRLLDELPEGSRRILERVSLKLGSFTRSFVLDMAHIEPAVTDAGLIFDKLIGSWIDQQGLDNFALSPLLSNLALNTLSAEQKININFEIANTILKSQTLDPIEANAALLAALIGNNNQVIMYLCLSIINEDPSTLKMIAPHLITCSKMRTDVNPYALDPGIAQVFRGTQLILLCHDENSSDKFIDAINSFRTESKKVDELPRSMFALVVYSKVLLSEPLFGSIPHFLEIIIELDKIINNSNGVLPQDILQSFTSVPGTYSDISAFGAMFANQARLISSIQELESLFTNIDLLDPSLRKKLLSAYQKEEFNVDILVAAPWLFEHEAGTINPELHVDIYSRLEEFARSWSEMELAIACCKYQAIILDEYANDKDKALIVLDAGLERYNPSNPELLRAKAKVLFRSGNHEDSLDLSQELLDSDLPLSKIEIVFFNRDAAISSEKLERYETARSLYLNASAAAEKCSSDEMKAMRVGLLADAALASWHSGDRKRCLYGLIQTLQALADIDPKGSLRATHCHATSRHILLWLTQEATGAPHLLANDEKTEIYPGIVSNPEPSPEIEKHQLTSMDMAWYMLATLEQRCLYDIGITQALESRLTNGPQAKGEILLTCAKIDKAIHTQDISLLIYSLGPTIAQFFYFKSNPNLDEIKVIPPLSQEQQAELSELSELFVLSFLLEALFQEKVEVYEELQRHLTGSSTFKIREPFLLCLYDNHKAKDFNTSLANLLRLHFTSKKEDKPVVPVKIFHTAIKALQVAAQVNNLTATAGSVSDWLAKKWTFILQSQRFQLITPSIYESIVTKAITEAHTCEINRSIDILLAMLPMMGINNPTSLVDILESLRSR